jgi:hypothetical protein
MLLATLRVLSDHLLLAFRQSCAFMLLGRPDLAS